MYEQAIKHHSSGISLLPGAQD